MPPAATASPIATRLQPTPRAMRRPRADPEARRRLPEVGLEPTLPKRETDFESVASANSATPATCGHHPRFRHRLPPVYQSVNACATTLPPCPSERPNEIHRTQPSQVEGKLGDRRKNSRIHRGPLKCCSPGCCYSSWQSRSSLLGLTSVLQKLALSEAPHRIRPTQATRPAPLQAKPPLKRRRQAQHRARHRLERW